MTDVARKKLFLSHASEDADFAHRLISQIEEVWQLQIPGPIPEVFCTSHPEHRFKANWHEESQRRDEELRQYLRQNLVGSTAYLVLVTKRRLRNNSAWNAFEIDVADEIARERGLFFSHVRPKGPHVAPVRGRRKCFRVSSMLPKAR